MSSPVVTSALVKELREKTGVGMAKCKEALDKANGNMEEAIALLRKAGMMSAAKKEGRSTKEGAVVSFQTNDVVAVVEVDAETDFVVKNDRFQEFCNNIVQEVALKRPATVEEFLQQPYSKDTHITIDQYRSLLIQTIGENIQVRRVAVFVKQDGQSIGVYSHLGGKLLTVIVLEGSGEEQLAREVAMHVAAAFPQYLSPEEIPQEVIQMEKDVAAEQVKGKPANIIDKILQGKLSAFYDQCCLTRQKYIRDDSVSVEEYVKKQGAAHGKEVRILGFLRWMAGKE
jgi:elongation factor Ts